MTTISTTATAQFVSSIRDHFKKEGVDLSQVASLEIECKHVCQMHLIQENLSHLEISCKPDQKKFVLQPNIYSFFDLNQGDYSGRRSLHLALSLEKTKKFVKGSFSELEIAKHDKKFYKGQNKKAISILEEAQKRKK